MQRAVLEIQLDSPVELETRDPCLVCEGTAANVARQLLRYAPSEHVAVLLLVTTRRTHGVMPRVLMGKPLMTLCVGARFYDRSG